MRSTERELNSILGPVAGFRYSTLCTAPVKPGNGGGERIRTPEGLRPGGFQNRCIQPLCHASARGGKSSGESRGVASPCMQRVSERFRRLELSLQTALWPNRSFDFRAGRTNR